MPRVRLFNFARCVSLGLCLSMVVESPARASPYAGSLRLVGYAPAGEVLEQPVPGQTPDPVVVKRASQTAHGEGGSAQVVAPTGGAWMQPQIQVVVQPQIQVHAEPRGDASPRAVATVHADTASEGAAEVHTDTASEVLTLPRVETAAAAATTCPVTPAETSPKVAVAPAPSSVAPIEVPPTRPSGPRPGRFGIGAGTAMFVLSSFGVGALAAVHQSKCERGGTRHCELSHGLMAIPVAGPLMTARDAGELARAHVAVGLMQGIGLAMLLVGVTRLIRDHRRTALSADGVRVGKNTAIRAGSGLTLTTRF
jgi:hypothetical protein